MFRTGQGCLPTTFRNVGYIRTGDHSLSKSEVESIDVPIRLIDYASFAPFLVVFTHAIAAHSQSDVSLLSQTLTTLESMRSRSETHTKLCQKCRVFLRFAKAFVQSQSQNPSSGFQNEEDGSFVFSTTGATMMGESVGYLADVGVGSGADFPNYYGLGAGNGDLESMSAFLGSCFGEGSMMGGIWNTGYQGP